MDGGSSRFELALNKTLSLSRLRRSGGRGRSSEAACAADLGQLRSKSSTNRSDFPTG